MGLECPTGDAFEHDRRHAYTQTGSDYVFNAHYVRMDGATDGALDTTFTMARMRNTNECRVCRVCLCQMRKEQSTTPI